MPYCADPSLPTDANAVSPAVAPVLAPIPGQCPAPGRGASPDLAPGPARPRPGRRGIKFEDLLIPLHQGFPIPVFGTPRCACFSFLLNHNTGDF